MLVRKDFRQQSRKEIGQSRNGQAGTLQQKKLIWQKQIAKSCFQSLKMKIVFG
jgi:hypothetical protein